MTIGFVNAVNRIMVAVDGGGAPGPTDGLRVTEDGDARVTEDGDERIIE